MFIVILKSIGTAILAGLFLFALPFLIFKAIFFFLLLGLIFRLFSGRRRYRRWRHYHSGFYGYPNAGFGEPQREYLADPLSPTPQKV